MFQVIFALLGIVLAMDSALACSCGSWSTFDELANWGYNGKTSTVVRVKTLSTDGRGGAQLEVKEVLKGEISKKQISVLGQDGLNCSGSVLDSQDWLVVLQPTWGYGPGVYDYDVGSCGESSLEIGPNELVNTKITDAPLSLDQIRDLLSGNIQKEAKALNCRVHWNQTPRKFPTETDEDWDRMLAYSKHFNTSIGSADSLNIWFPGPMNLVSESKESKVISDLRISLRSQGKSLVAYAQLKTSILKDPITMQRELKPTESSSFGLYSDLPVRTKLDGFTPILPPGTESDEPHLSHDIGIQCQVKFELKP